LDRSQMGDEGLNFILTHIFRMLLVEKKKMLISFTIFFSYSILDKISRHKNQGSTDIMEFFPDIPKY
jgi:hypothetical protein